MVDAKRVKELRTMTGAGMMEAKAALLEAQGNLEKAVEILRKKGQLAAGKKAMRATGQGLIDSYIHGEGKIGVMLEVNCETDFVARNEEFKRLVHDLALQVAASNPFYVSRDQVPQGIIKKETEIYREQARAEGKPALVVDRIVAGKLEKFYQEACLLEQPFIRDQDMTIKELIADKIATIGENIQVKRFVRYVLGE